MIAVSAWRCSIFEHFGAPRTWAPVPKERTATQATEYLQIARSWVEPGRRMSLAGDFNLEPSELPGDYTDLVDLVVGDTHHAREGLTKQIDYILVQRVGNPIRYPSFCTDLASQASDHCFTHGDWQL